MLTPPEVAGYQRNCGAVTKQEPAPKGVKIVVTTWDEAWALREAIRLRKTSGLGNIGLAIDAQGEETPGWAQKLEGKKQVIVEFKRLGIKDRGTLGGRSGDAKQINILNRIISLDKEGVKYEADPKH